MYSPLFFGGYQKFSLGKESRKINNPRRIFEDDLLSELEKNDLIRPSDFEAFKSTKSKPHELKAINSSGYVTIHGNKGKGVRYADERVIRKEAKKA